MIDIIAGARPNFMKIAPIIRALDPLAQQHEVMKYRLVHTGQHYDARMSGDFFAQLGIPHPQINLEVGSGTQAEQTGAIMARYEQLLERERSDLCLVVGDVTSTMACAIVARKAGVPVAHVEAGIRSGDWTMPEEINRVVTDSITNYFFTTSKFANQNLQRAGVPDDAIFFVGNTMIDTLLANMDALKPPDFWQSLALQPRQYFVLTLHRPANVDDFEHLHNLLQVVDDAAGEYPVLFPMHPRTAQVLKSAGRSYTHIQFVEPQPYLEFNYVVKNALGVITDSGGITEETTVMGIPCITVRDSTERPETVDVGTNELVGTDPAAIKTAMAKMLSGKWKTGAIPDKWDGAAAERIVEILHGTLRPKDLRALAL